MKRLTVPNMKRLAAAMALALAAAALGTFLYNNVTYFAINATAPPIIKTANTTVYLASSYCPISLSARASLSSAVVNGLNVTQISLTAWGLGWTVNYSKLFNICNRGPYTFSITLNAVGVVSPTNAGYISSLKVFQYGNPSNYVAFSGTTVTQPSTLPILLAPGQCVTFGIAVTTTASATTSVQGPTYQVNVLASAGDLKVLEIMYISVYINASVSTSTTLGSIPFTIPSPRVYQGAYYNASNGVVYSTNAFPYYSPTLGSIEQPNIVLVPAQQYSAGAMFWKYQYNYSGGVPHSVTITLLGTFTTGTYPYAEGYEIYFFIKPFTWTISGTFNYSIPYAVSSPANASSPVQGLIILPLSSSPYIMVQWDPYWQYGYKGGGGGQFNIWIVTATKQGRTIVVKITGWNGIGSGAFMPSPYDLICFTAIYNVTTNAITAYAVDLNTGAVASVSQSLAGYFIPPTAGAYALGVAGNTGSSYADWRVLYVTYVTYR